MITQRQDTKSLFYDAWPTAWGPVGAAAGAGGITRLILPHYPMDDLLALLAWQHSRAQRGSEPFSRLIELTREYFAGRPADFDEIPCDAVAGKRFSATVLRACRAIPYGRTVSYSGLAERIGRGEAARAVATALGKNPVPLIVPCHRIIYSNGSPGGFSAEGGPALKQRMLALEETAKAGA